MQKYYICTTGIAKGPFTLEDLYGIEVCKKDLIWGSQWRRARYAHDISELKKHFREKWTAQNDSKKVKSTVIQQRLLLSSLLGIIAAVMIYFLWLRS